MITIHIYVGNAEPAGIRHTLDIHSERQMISERSRLFPVIEPDIVPFKNNNPFSGHLPIVDNSDFRKIRLPDVQLILHPFCLPSVYGKCPIDCKGVRFYRLSETSPKARQQYDRSKNNLSHTHSELIVRQILAKITP